MSGLPWFKLSIDYFQHPKTNALKYELAEPLADAYPARIMAHLARFRAEGWIADSADEIAKLELSVGWGGTSGGLVEALIKVGIMDRRRGRIVLHGWVEWQEAHAKKAAMDRARMRARRAKPASSLDKGRATVARRSRARQRRRRRQRRRGRS